MTADPIAAWEARLAKRERLDAEDWEEADAALDAFRDELCQGMPASPRKLNDGTWGAMLKGKVDRDPKPGDHIKVVPKNSRPYRAVILEVLSEGWGGTGGTKYQCTVRCAKRKNLPW